MANIEELKRIKKELQALPPERWNQEVWLVVDEDVKPGDVVYWSCHTTGCVAGHTCLVNGLVPSWDKESELWRDCVMEDPHTGRTGVMVDEEAAKILELEDWEADMLFDGGMTRTQVFAIIDALCEGATEDELYDAAWLPEEREATT